MCDTNRRPLSWEKVCDLDFSGFPAYSQRSYPLLSFFLCFHCNKEHPHASQVAGARGSASKSQYSRMENRVFLPGKGWRESMFAFPLKSSLSLWNSIKHNIYVKNGNISNRNMVLLQYEHFPKEEDENV